MVSYYFPPMHLRLFLTTFASPRISLLGKKIRSFNSSSGGNYSATRNQNVGMDRDANRVAKGEYSYTAGQNSPRKLIDGAKKRTECLFDSANEDEFPSLVASVSTNKNKRRNRIHLGKQFEQKPEQGGELTSPVDFNSSFSSNSASQPEELHFPGTISVRGKDLRSSRGTNFRPGDHTESSKQVPLEPSLPTSSSQRDKSSSSLGFRKVNLPVGPDRPNPHRISSDQERGLKSSRETMSKPFDVCLSDSRKKYFLKPSLPVKEQSIQMDSSVVENGEILRPGMVLLKGYIPLSQQVEIVLKCQELGLGPGGFYQPGYADGAKLRLHMMCLGLDWDPQTRKYGKKRQHDNSKPPDIPLDFSMLVRNGLHDAHALIKQQTRRSDVEEILPSMSPDICIVNFYTTNGRLGLHQDRDESRYSLSKGLPVVSFSIGDTCEFLYGDQRDIDQAESVFLKSGDVLIFGGESRHVFHGVTSIIPKTAPRALSENAKLRPGRLNLTFRKY